MANRLARRLSPKDWTITVVDRDLRHVYQPGLLFVPFGAARPDELVRDRAFFLPPEVKLVLEPVERVDLEKRRLRFAGGPRSPTTC